MLIPGTLNHKLGTVQAPDLAIIHCKSWSLHTERELKL